MSNSLRFLVGAIGVRRCCKDGLFLDYGGRGLNGVTVNCSSDSAPQAASAVKMKTVRTNDITKVLATGGFDL